VAEFSAPTAVERAGNDVAERRDRLLCGHRPLAPERPGDILPVHQRVDERSNEPDRGARRAEPAVSRSCATGSPGSNRAARSRARDRPAPWICLSSSGVTIRKLHRRSQANLQVKDPSRVFERHTLR
jgi:hypothetical protein